MTIDLAAHLDLIAAISILVPAAAACDFARRRWSDPDWRHLAPWIAGTALALAVFFASYVWLFQLDGCSARSDFVCLVNKNQGFLALIALSLTGLGLWVSAIQKEGDRRAARSEEHRRARLTLQAAVEEVVHNLMHIAGSYDDAGSPRVKPVATTTSVKALLDPIFRSHIHPRVVSASDGILRNVEALARHSESIPVRGVEALVLQSLRMLVASAKYHRPWCDRLFERPGLQDIRSAAHEPECRIVFSASQASDEAHEVRIKDQLVLCWRKDRAPKGVRCLEQEPRFKDLLASHSPSYKRQREVTTEAEH